jgi:adenylate cyclase
MGVEIERKFLVNGGEWRSAVVSSQELRQGYLGGSRCSVRVRVAGDSAWLNVKSLSLGPARSEYEFAIGVDEAGRLLAEFCDPVLEKVRHLVPYQGWQFEVDEFRGDNEGLVVAELELPATDAQFPRPHWLGAEVTDDSRYYSVNLARSPYRRWPARGGAGTGQGI